MVRETILKAFNRIVIPFATVSTSFLFFNINRTYAATTGKWETLLERGDVRRNTFLKEAGKKDLGEFIDKWDSVLDFLTKSVHWINHLPENIAQLSVTLLTKLYELLMMTLHTPLFIFDNSLLKDATLTFSSCSIIIVIVLTTMELMKKMIRKKHTDFKEICARWALAVIGSGFAPFLFKQTFQIINMLTKAITQIGAKEMASEGVMGCLKLSGFHTAMLLGFDIILIYLMIPIFLQNGRRFFDLMCLSLVTPLALTAWVFDDYRYLFDKWWNQLKTLGNVQLIYSVFICIMGIFIFGTRNIVTGGAFFLKVIVVIGGLYRLSNPPQFIQSKLDDGDDTIQTGMKMYKTFSNVKDTITFKNYTPLNILKKKLIKNIK